MNHTTFKRATVLALTTLVLTECPAPASAQQVLYAVTLEGDLFEVHDYATAPVAIEVLIDDYWLGYSQGVAVRPESGIVCIVEWGLGIPSIREFDVGTGAELQVCQPFAGLSSVIDALPSGGLIGQSDFGPGPYLKYEDPSLNACVTNDGALVASYSYSGIAVDNDGSVVSIRSGTTSLSRYDAVSGLELARYDIGLDLESIEIDTDGTVYGLTGDGTLWRMEFTTLSVVPLGLLGFSTRWRGLGFRQPVPPLDVMTACDGRPNSVALEGASIQIGDPTTTNLIELGVAVHQVAPGQAGFMLLGTATASTPLGSGTLCIDAAGIRRVPGVAAAGPDGVMRFTYDFDDFPVLGALSAGDSFILQCVYRDVGTIHASSAVAIHVL